MAGFTQIVEVKTGAVEVVKDLIRAWHREQAGTAPGYREVRVLEDKERPGTYLIEVEFASEQDAAENNDRPETSAWAQRLKEAVNGEPRYLNLSETFSTRS